MIKYEADIENRTISKTWVIRETPHKVYFSNSNLFGPACRKTEGEKFGYFDTWQEAKAYLIEKIEYEKMMAYANYISLDHVLEYVESMDDPDEH
jgi:hypothetical protein